MKYISDVSKRLIVWDPTRNTQLCRFVNREYETTDPHAMRILDSTPGVRRGDGSEPLDKGPVKEAEATLEDLTFTQLKNRAKKLAIDLPKGLNSKAKVLAYLKTVEAEIEAGGDPTDDGELGEDLPSGDGSEEPVTELNVDTSDTAAVKEVLKEAGVSDEEIEQVGEVLEIVEKAMNAPLEDGSEAEETAEGPEIPEAVKKIAEDLGEDPEKIIALSVSPDEADAMIKEAEGVVAGEGEAGKSDEETAVTGDGSGEPLPPVETDGEELPEGEGSEDPPTETLPETETAEEKKEDGGELGDPVEPASE